MTIQNIDKAFVGLNIEECCKIVTRYMPWEQYPGKIVDTVINLMAADSSEMDEDSFFYYMAGSYNINNPNPSYYYTRYQESDDHSDGTSGNWKSQLKILELVQKAKEMEIPISEVPADQQNAVKEFFMSYYQPFDDGDSSDNEELPKYSKHYDSFISNRHSHHTNIRKDKAKHGKTSCLRREWYGNYSMKTNQKQTSKKLRKELFVPSGKSGYKKMKEGDYIC